MPSPPDHLVRAFRALPAATLAVGLVLATVAPASATVAARPAPAGQLTGVVVDSSGVPVPGARLTWYESGLTSRDSVPVPVAVTDAAADGTFTTGLAAGSVTVLAQASGQPATWFGGAATPEHATPLDTSQPDPVRIVLRDPAGLGRIVGITHRRGTAVPGVLVAAFRARGGDEVVPQATVPTDQVGRYRLELPPGRYKVVADGSRLGLLRRWAPAGSWYADARPITVVPEAPVTRVRVNLDPEASLPPQVGRVVRAPRLRARLRHVPVDRVLPYQPQRRCRGSAQPGTLALRRLLLATYGREGIGLLRACRIGDRSEHKDGRAIDWMVNARTGSEAWKGDSFVRWATRSQGPELGAMARRLGIMYIIWRGRIWTQFAASAGWQVYRRCDEPDWPGRWQCHFDHVHISLNRAGARMRTSWWTGRALR